MVKGRNLTTVISSKTVADIWVQQKIVDLMHFIHKSLEETMIKVAMNKRKKNMAAAISKADKELKGKNSAEVIES